MKPLVLILFISFILIVSFLVNKNTIFPNREMKIFKQAMKNYNREETNKSFKESSFAGRVIDYEDFIDRRTDLLYLSVDKHYSDSFDIKIYSNDRLHFYCEGSDTILFFVNRGYLGGQDTNSQVKFYSRKRLEFRKEANSSKFIVYDPYTEEEFITQPLGGIPDDN